MVEKRESEVKLELQAALHEFIAMTLFVFIGCGVAKVSPSGSASTQTIAFAFGMAIMVLVYATAHTSGGQLNWCVTLGLAVGGRLKVLQACANMLAQLFGAVLGALLLLACLPEGERGTLGSNQVNNKDGYTAAAAFLGEFIFSFMLVWVIFQTAVDQEAITGTNDASRPIAAPIAIGFTVFLAHLFLIPIDGCSINPPRSFGPALVATINGQKGLFDDFWIFFVAPMLGGFSAGIFYRLPFMFGGDTAEIEDDGVEVTTVNTV